jgi:hypothetical protein
MIFSNLSKKFFLHCLEFIKSNLSGWRLLDRESTVMIFTSLIVGIGAGLDPVDQAAEEDCSQSCTNTNNQ